MFQKQRKKIHKGHKSLFSTGATMLSSQLLICVVLLSSCGAFSSGNVLDGMFLQFAFYRICLAGESDYILTPLHYHNSIPTLVELTSSLKFNGNQDIHLLDIQSTPIF